MSLHPLTLTEAYAQGQMDAEQCFAKVTQPEFVIRNETRWTQFGTYAAYVAGYDNARPRL
jgi:hypothetical protein